MVLIDEEAAGCAYTLQPNCAMSWRWTKRLFLGIFCCMAAFSAYWVSLGAWLVLPPGSSPRTPAADFPSPLSTEDSGFETNNHHIN